MQNKNATIQKFSLAFGLMVIITESLELGIQILIKSCHKHVYTLLVEYWL